VSRRRPSLRRAAWVAVASLACVVTCAGAADDADPGDCRPGGNQQQLDACAVRDYRAADAALNNRYREIMAALPAAPRMALRHDQREWLRRRDPSCKSKAKNDEGGSIWPLAFYGCLEQSTRKRTAELDGWKGRT
jgi:uncharacterized protein YecT (DUF1311 family)